MRITHLGHASLLVETGDARILVDPGTFSPTAHEQRHLDAVLVTHQHPDHVDQERLPSLLGNNPSAALLTDPDTAELLGDKGIEAISVAAGDRHEVGAATVTGVGQLHALIHDDIPRIRNTGMLVTAQGEPTFFHPGDSLDAEPGPVDVLAFPLSAPWQASRDMTAFLRRFAAPHAIPVHDALLNDAGRRLYLTQAANLGSRETRIHDLADGTPQQFRP
jgi:L-ascorbate metabolism protein UlaG (beta-lactamase superfamily)